MSVGDWFVILFVAVIFCLGIYGGIKLFRWNMRDHNKMMDKNEELKQEKDPIIHRLMPFLTTSVEGQKAEYLKD